MSADCRCMPDLSGAAWCPQHRCDCNIMCGHLGKRRPHVFAPGEWCGGNDETWRERSPAGRCRQHPDPQPEAVPTGAASVVKEVFAARKYTDLSGRLWSRGLDGWFHDGPDHTVWLLRHDEMAQMISDSTGNTIRPLERHQP